MVIKGVDPTARVDPDIHIIRATRQIDTIDLKRDATPILNDSQAYPIRFGIEFVTNQTIFSADDNRKIGPAIRLVVR